MSLPPNMAPTPEEIPDLRELTDIAPAQFSYFPSFESLDGRSDSYFSDEITEPDDCSDDLGHFSDEITDPDDYSDLAHFFDEITEPNDYSDDLDLGHFFDEITDLDDYSDLRHFFDEITEADDYSDDLGILLGQNVGFEAERCVFEEFIAWLTFEDLVYLDNKLMDSSNDVSASNQPPLHGSCNTSAEFRDSFRCFVNSDDDMHKGCNDSYCDFCTMSTQEHCFEELECESTTFQNSYCEQFWTKHFLFT